MFIILLWFLSFFWQNVPEMEFLWCSWKWLAVAARIAEPTQTENVMRGIYEENEYVYSYYMYKYNIGATAKFIFISSVWCRFTTEINDWKD